MTAQNISTKQSPWLAVSIGLLGLAIGYILVMGRSGTLAFAGSAMSCPMKETCTGKDCNKNLLCASGTCSKDCPGNCTHSI